MTSQLPQTRHLITFFHTFDEVIRRKLKFEALFVNRSTSNFYEFVKSSNSGW